MDAGYKDRFLWVGVYPLMAIGAVHIANDNSFAKLLSLPSYYTDLLFSCGFVYSTGFYLRLVVAHLDQKFNWVDSFRQRLARQLFFGVLVPSAALVLAESTYLIYGLGIPLSESSIVYLELPISFIFLLLINLCYYVLFLRIQTKGIVKAPTLYPPFMVSKGYRQQAITQDEIAYFFIEGGTTFLCTKTNARFAIQESIESLEKQINPHHFFKLNRQILASHGSIEFVENTPTRKLAITLNPRLTESVHVSKANATEFQKWWRQPVPAST